MAAQEKIDTLRRIEREDKFREAVLLPLLDKMGLAPVHTHGPNERGKDIVCKESNSFDLVEWIAVVAKVGRITGSTSGQSSLSTILNQIVEAFDYSYKDPATKTNVSINKVIVVTNHEILATAKDKLVDKLGKPGPQRANTHFIDDQALAALIDEHWADFWRMSSDLLADEDRMSEHAGLVLYVLARAHVQSKVARKKKVEAALTQDKIRRQAALTKPQVDAALTYLRQTEYVEETKDKTYRLHRNKTVGYLLLVPDQIRLLYAIRGVVPQDLHFTLDDVRKEAKKEVLSFAQPFVRQTLQELENGGYIKLDESRGKGHYHLDMDMVDDERPYLDSQLKFLGRLPTQVE